MSKTKECFAYNTKIIETPTTKEVYIYENPIFIHSKEKADLTDTSNRKKFDEMSAHKQYDSLKRKQKHYEQARWDIARIVDCNFDNKTKFVTLTFKENIQEILITNPLNGEKHRKFEDIVDEYLSQIDEEERTKTYKLYRLATNKFMQFIGNGSLMEHITPIRMNQYISWLKKTKLSSTTINIHTVEIS